MITIKDYEKLWRLGGEMHNKYVNNAPFPNTYIDKFLPNNVYQEMKEYLPRLTSSKAWKKNEVYETKGKYVLRGQKVPGGTGLKDFSVDSVIRNYLFEFNSGPFLYFLERISGIKGLIGDPYWRESGFHFIERGGFLHSHADYSHHEYLNLERRVNFFIFFNDEWKEEYGGHLSLFDLDGNAVQSILPLGNRCAIFTTSNTSFHGHPEPLKCPEGMLRKSLALYYYTNPTERQRSKIIFQK